MQYSELCERISGEGAEAWATHAAGIRDRAAGREVYLLSVGDPDFDTPPAVVEAAVEALRGGDTHYTDINGRPEVRTAVAARFNARSGCHYDERNVTLTAGCQNALYCAAAVLLAPGDEAVVFDPTYVTYAAAIGATGARVVSAPCPAGDGFRPDLDALAACIGPRTRAIFLVTPVNPTGVVFNAEELQRIAALARAHDLWVVSDEVYAEQVFEGNCQSIAALEGMAERTVTISSLSKSHAMTGWRAGWAIGPRDFSRHLANLSLCMTYGLPGFVQQAALCALGDDGGDSRRLCDTLRARRDRVVEMLRDAPGLRCEVPQAGMFIMLDVRGSGLPSGDFVRELYRRHAVTSIDGKAFGAAADGCVRLAFTTGEDALAEACRRIRAFAAELAGA